MAYFLRILSGEAGSRISSGESEGSLSMPLGQSFTIGRTTGDYILADPKASGHHARLEWNGKNYILSDLGSSNGTKVAGHPIRSISLEPGATFQVGDTLFEFYEILEQNYQTETPEPLEAAETGETAEPSLKINATWQQEMLDYITRWQATSDSLEFRPIESFHAHVFSKPVHLRVTQGLSYKSQFSMGWGPRVLTDQHNLDLHVSDLEISPILLTFSPTSGRVLLTAEQPGVVEVNGQLAKRFFLNSGDEIAFGETRITVTIEE